MIRIHRSRISSLFRLLFDSALHAIEESLDGMSSAQRNGAAFHGASVLYIDTQSTSDHGQAAVPQSNGQTSQALEQLWASQNSCEQFALLVRRHGFYSSVSRLLADFGCGTGGRRLLGKEEKRRGEVGAESINLHWGRAGEPGKGSVCGEEFGECGEGLVVKLLLLLLWCGL